MCAQTFPFSILRMVGEIMLCLPMFNTECTVLFQPSMFNTVFMPSKSVLAENCVCLCKQLCRCYSDRPKILILYSQKYRRTKVPSSEKWRNGPLFRPCNVETKDSTHPVLQSGRQSPLTVRIVCRRCPEKRYKISM